MAAVLRREFDSPTLIFLSFRAETVLHYLPRRTEISAMGSRHPDRDMMNNLASLEAYIKMIETALNNVKTATKFLRNQQRLVTNLLKVIILYFRMHQIQS